MKTIKSALNKDKKNEDTCCHPLNERDYLSFYRKNGFVAITLDKDASKTQRVFGGNIVCCILCTQGSSHFLLDAKEYKVEKGEALVIDSEFFIKTISNSKDFEAIVLVCHKLFLFPPTIQHDMDLHFYLLQHPVLNIGEEKTYQLNKIFEVILEKQREDIVSQGIFPKTFNKNILCHLSKALCYEIFEQYRQQVPFGQIGIKSSNKKSIVLRFLHLLREKVVTERNISYYSSSLGITPQYLATVLKSVTGLSSSQWMHILIIEKAKYLLLTEKMSISEVAQTLNYPDQSTFGKMFKAETGMSPIQFKKEVDANR